jgi:diaminopimelate epimerase
LLIIKGVLNMRFRFSKYQGAGNDFILIEDPECTFPQDDQVFVKKLCDRRFGIGADGLMLLRPSLEKDFKMLYFNSDGLEGTMCGNGGRCLVAFAKDCGFIDKNKNIIFEAIDGEHSAHIIRPGYISLKMIDVQGVTKKSTGYFANTGSLHHVEYVKNLVDKDVETMGKTIRNSSDYAPLGCNVNFIEAGDNNEIRIRTYERGVEGETLACGTGSVASAIVHHYTGHVFSEYIIKALGGELKVRFDYADGIYKNVWLDGPTTYVFKGEWTS